MQVHEDGDEEDLDEAEMLEAIEHAKKPGVAGAEEEQQADEESQTAADEDHEEDSDAWSTSGGELKAQLNLAHLTPSGRLPLPPDISAKSLSSAMARTAFLVSGNCPGERWGVIVAILEWVPHEGAQKRQHTRIHTHTHRERERKACTHARTQ